MSITQARRYILILHSQAEIRQAIQSGQIENIKLIELICSMKNIEHQSELLQATVHGLPFEKILKLKKELENSIKKNKELRGRKKN